MVRLQHIHRLYDGLILVLIAAFFLLTPLQIVVFDDAYVYFTYARNFAEGRPFAYDPRNIPSEGFTSLLYMLLLVPAELLHLNPIWISALINLCALALSIVWLGQAARATGALSGRAATIFALLLTILLLQDYNIRSLVLSGFEAILGALCVIGMVVSAAYALEERRTVRARKRWLSVFFSMTFLAHLVRPEYLLIGALGSAVLLWRSADRAVVIRRAAIFALTMLGYYLLKLAIFGDLFPTGFYRKVRVSALGVSYVQEWLSDYQNVLLLSFLALVTLVIALRRHAVWLAIWAGGAVLIVLFYTQTVPLSAVWHRFLVAPIWASYALCAFGAAWLLEVLARLSKVRAAWLAEVGRAALLCLTPLLIISKLGLSPAEVERALREEGVFNLHVRAERALRENLYLQLGWYWRSQLAEPSTLTIAYNEAGALPYALGSRFIDLYGLAEVEIARLFSLPDGDVKTARYIAHVLAQQPSILLMLNYGEADQAVWHGFADPHSPFHSAPPAAVYEAYYAYGLRYACSVNHWGLKLHILVWRDSPQGAQTLSEAFCGHPSAYRLPNGLTVETTGGSTHFPLYDADAAAAPQ
ncbi:MAG: hypothetical protein RML95_11375 [Anaerolineae bacterium]|nr:hypothetical protein [Anaerolineae bacterium]